MRPTKTSLLIISIAFLLAVTLLLTLSKWSNEEKLLRKKQTFLLSGGSSEILTAARNRNLRESFRYENEIGAETEGQGLPANPLAANNLPGARVNGLLIWALGGAELCRSNCKMQNDRCQIQKIQGCFYKPTNYLINHCKNWNYQICKARNLVCDRECQNFGDLLNGRSAAARPPRKFAVFKRGDFPIQRGISKKFNFAVGGKGNSFYNFRG